MTIFYTVLQSSHPFSQTLISELIPHYPINQINEHLIYLSSTAINNHLLTIAEKHLIDIACIPDTRKLSNVSLIVMDMDSTLITIECIDEIADFMGIKSQVAAITESAMRGEIDFPESLRRRVGLLKGLPESTLSQVYEERLHITPGGEDMLSHFHQQGIETLLVSGGFTFFTEKLQKKLNITYSKANTLEIKNGLLTGQVVGDIIDAKAKAYWLNYYLHNQKEPKEVVAIGDGANDLLMMKEADISIAYHAKPIVRKEATHALTRVDLSGVIPLLEIQHR
ncbi:MAG: phosphoserine phosphatase SerB [Ferrovum sp. 37-45-19]|jgi:phosphoserine phosphatase|nr:MAG: phosphoserine phosphatase SerB [Ferrovum sp. 21-44-67]OYV94092.1 MAG: phosphoserine phosphatase SerB [Ferrovum sp. 37-45-19]OZB33982.1 MAG: phosphoserine phosphatase SerB [Ferrovum sp. 34-44-207]HQT82086.1 phosphoserine phosphatase SerB [Ferrovaceae bacterium]HQU05836.1 phosphoserine phosphatase SerB [Ferrovaceae bacterium]